MPGVFLRPVRAENGPRSRLPRPARSGGFSGAEGAIRATRLHIVDL